jgi:hypothetical protein
MRWVKRYAGSDAVRVPHEFELAGVTVRAFTQSDADIGEARMEAKFPHVELDRNTSAWARHVQTRAGRLAAFTSFG